VYINETSVLHYLPLAISALAGSDLPNQLVRWPNRCLSQTPWRQALVPTFVFFRQTYTTWHVDKPISVCENWP